MMKKLLYQKMILLLLFIGTSSSIALAQVSGKITSIDEVALIGANVVIKGTSTGGITDLDGNFQVDANQGDVLVISYTGFLSQEITVNGAAINIQLSEDVTNLSDIVVTATRQPIRKIQTTTAINTIGAEAIAMQQPESFGEAIAYVPGVTVENSQGRKSSFNIRGFPSGNTYVTTLLDGLPLSGFASRSAGTAEFIGLDKGIERIEVVRGSGATLFGRAAAAGAVNIITRTGGDEIGGMVSVTKFNNVVGDDHRFSGDFDYRADFNINGPLADNLKFNVSGYLMNDSGYKEWAIKDKGTQISGNLDYEFANQSTIRVYGMFGNNQFNNLTDSPYNIGTGELADGWENYNTFYPDNRQLDFNSTLKTSVFSPAASEILDANGNQIIQNQADRNREEVIGGYVGLSANFNLGNSWSLGAKIRTQSYDWRDHNEITFSSFYTAESNILRLNANSTGTINDVIGEVRISKLIESDNAKHSISGGIYFSDAAYDRFGGLHWYNSNVNPAPTYSWFGPPGTPPPTAFSLSSTTSHQEESVFSFFIGDEMTFNEKLTVNAGIRYDKMTGFFNNDPDVVDGIDYNPETVSENEIDFSDWSWSLGANYLLQERSAIYASYLRAFSLPSVGLSTGIPEENEIVNNIEVGYRIGVGDLGIDIGVFNTVINNRLASVFDPAATGGQTFVTRPVGTNKVQGGELELTYAPSSVKGLLFRGTFTLQKSEFDGLQIALDKIDHDRDPATPSIPEVDINGDLFGLNLVTLDAANNNYAIDVTGNQVHNTPTTIVTFNTSYNTKFFGLGFDVAHYAGRMVGALNLIEAPDLTIANANIYGQMDVNGNRLRLGLRIKNLFNSANAQQYVLGSANDTVLVQKQKTPNFNNTLGFGVSQIPRRVLLTLSYDF